MGIGGALETLCGQAYGAKQYQMLGVHLQRAMVVLMLMGVPISIVWTFTGQIFIIFGQDLKIAKEAANYAHWLIPSIFPYGLLQCQIRLLQTQNNLKPLMLSIGFASLLHVGCCWILVLKLGFGSSGAALSVAISYGINVVILCIYIRLLCTCERTWVGFSKEGVRGLGGFLALDIPSALMVCLEHWSYEFSVLLCGILLNLKLETSMMCISLSTISLAYRIPFGFGNTVRYCFDMLPCQSNCSFYYICLTYIVMDCTRVSNELGAGKHKPAKLAALVDLSLVIAEVLIVGLVLMSARGVWANLYTDEAEVVSYVSLVMPVLAVSNIMDGVQGVLSGFVDRERLWERGSGVTAFSYHGAYKLAIRSKTLSHLFCFLVYMYRVITTRTNRRLSGYGGCETKKGGN